MELEMTDPGKNDAREMYAEISALLGGLAKAFALGESDVISALESGHIEMTFETDANGNPFALATFQGQSAQLYADAVKHPAKPPGS